MADTIEGAGAEELVLLDGRPVDGGGRWPVAVPLGEAVVDTMADPDFVVSDPADAAAGDAADDDADDDDADDDDTAGDDTAGDAADDDAADGDDTAGDAADADAADGDAADAADETLSATDDPPVGASPWPTVVFPATALSAAAVPIDMLPPALLADACRGLPEPSSPVWQAVSASRAKPPMMVAAAVVAIRFMMISLGLGHRVRPF